MFFVVLGVCDDDSFYFTLAGGAHHPLKASTERFLQSRRVEGRAQSDVDSGRQTQTGTSASLDAVMLLSRFSPVKWHAYMPTGLSVHDRARYIGRLARTTLLINA